MKQQSGNCFHCGQSLNHLQYGRQDNCPKCSRDTHVCLNCQFHDPSYNNECRENQADRVVDKDKSNFCDYFTAKSQEGSGAQSKESLRAAADALFKK